MGLQPNIARRRSFAIKTCNRCGGTFAPSNFAMTKSIFYPDGSLPICNDCVELYLVDVDFDWQEVNKLCQYADIPFVPKEWERMRDLNGTKAFGKYAEIFSQTEYEDIGWTEYFEAFKEMKKKLFYSPKNGLLRDDYDEAKVNEFGGKYQGLDRYEARKAVVADLDALGLLHKIEDHSHNVGQCYRCGTTVEPRVSLQWFVKMEQNDPEALEIWNWFKDISMVEFERIYDLLGISFDSYLGESFYRDKVPALVEKLKEMELLVESQGAQVIDLEKYDMPTCLITKSDGGSIYHSRDIAAILYRKETYDFEKCLYVTGLEQSLHFKQIFTAIEVMGYD